MSAIPIDELGPLAALLDDPQISEIMIDRPDRICVERRGKLEVVDARFADAPALIRAIQAIIGPQGYTINESNPIVEVRLADRTLVTAVIPPISPGGPCAVIRKFPVHQLTADDLVSFGSWNRDILAFLRACVRGRINILVAGSSGSGKTTILNLLGAMIPPAERIILVERTYEIILEPQRGLRLEGRPANLDGRGAVTMADLVQQALKMRPERLVLGELQGAEVWYLLQALGTGHDGSMALMHANNPRDALARLEVMATMAEPSIPLLSIRQQIAAGINLIVQVQRLANGTRRVTHVSEVTGLDRDLVATRDLFRHEEGVQGEEERFVATGVTPSFLPTLLQRGVELPMEMFRPG